MYRMQIPEQIPLDAKWHKKLVPLIVAAGETFELLMPPKDQLDSAREKFIASGYQDSPELYPCIRNVETLEKARHKLQDLGREMQADEPNEHIQEAYQSRIQELAANIDMVLAAGERDADSFLKASTFVYGRPDTAIFGASCAWIRAEALKLSEKRPDLATLCDEVLKLVPDVQGDIGLLFPDDEVFNAVKRMHFAPGGYISRLLGDLDLAPDVYITREIGDSIIKKAITNVGSTFELVDSANGLWAYLASQGKVVRPPNFVLSHQAFTGIVAHEVGSHLLELENGRKSRLQLLQFGMDRFEMGNEGRAFVREQIMYDRFDDYVDQLLWHPTKASWEYRVAIHLMISLVSGLNGRSYGFAELYKIVSALFRFWTAKRGGEIDDDMIQNGAWSMTVRALKGTDGRGGAYLKDIVYLEGHVRCWQVARERPEMILVGDIGKFDISNARHIMILERLGILPSTHS